VGASGGYLGLRLDRFLEEVASAEPAPGGGFVAGLAVAMGAALVAMAARLSREWPEARGAVAQANALRERASQLAQRNVDAYIEAITTLRGGGAEPGARDDAIGQALERAALIPLQIGETAADVGALAATVAESGEPSLRADAAVAATLSLAGAMSAATLVEVNLATSPGDELVTRARRLVDDTSAALEWALSTVQ
jgi:formiminotetrahydrofolate cyclodeaminase